MQDNRSESEMSGALSLISNFRNDVSLIENNCVIKRFPRNLTERARKGYFNSGLKLLFLSC